MFGAKPHQLMSRDIFLFFFFSRYCLAVEETEACSEGFRMLIEVCSGSGRNGDKGKPGYPTIVGWSYSTLQQLFQDGE